MLLKQMSNVVNFFNASPSNSRDTSLLEEIDFCNFLDEIRDCGLTRLWASGVDEAVQPDLISESTDSSDE